MKQPKQKRPRTLDAGSLAHASGGINTPQPWRLLDPDPQPWIWATSGQPQPW